MLRTFDTRNLFGLTVAMALLIPSASAECDSTAIEEITVTATLSETRLDESPASVVIVGRGELDRAASPAVDDALRAVPGFTLFRRASSRTANPTTQGVSLRGIGASGASRSIVLWDGVPMNDPFGGWVYWGRLTSEAVSRVEVLRGGGSDIYGGGALAGVINVLRRPTDSNAVSVRAAGGEDGLDASLWLVRRWGDWSVSAAAERYDGEGYVLVESPSRGAVDVSAFSERTSVEVEIAKELRARRYSARISAYDEDRGNGTPLQTNATSSLQFAGGGSWHSRGNDFSVRVFGAEQEYEQTFSAISIDRSSERLSRSQSVPSESIGGNAVLRRPLTSSLFLITGIDGRRVHGVSSEQIFGPATVDVDSGGTQEAIGAFVEVLASVGPRLAFSFSGRGDAWSDEAIGGGSARSLTAFSPRINATFRVTQWMNVTASSYRSFRPPTLNELYRAFRVGNVLTLANPALEAETLEAFEGGFIMAGSGVSRLRVTGFRMDVEQPVANVTVSVTPDLITRERRNLGETRSTGVEVDGEQSFGSFVLNAGYLYVDARVRASDASLAGLRVPQVPAHQATLGAQYRAMRGALAAVELRWSDVQFEDDRNALLLRKYLVADAFFSTPLNREWTLFGAVENLTDEAIEAGRTPLVTLGPPRSARAGLRWRR